LQSILHDLREAADWVAGALRGSGYPADFSPDSLIEIDRFFTEQTVDGQPKRRGLLSESTGSRLFAIGGYVGEVMRRNVGGEWRGDDSDPEAEINVDLALPDGTVCWPVQRVMKRFKLGPEESVAAYGASIGLTYTRSMWPALAAAERRPWWHIWRHRGT
jgi:hypothetical protein